MKLMKRPVFYFACIVIVFISIIYSCCKENIDEESSLPYLRGMNVAWNERTKVQGSHAGATHPEASWFTCSDVVRMKNAGANCLELHQIGLPELMSERGIPDEEFFETFLDEWVDWCTRNEMYCIINITGFGAWADWAFYLSMPSWLYEGTGVNVSDKPSCDSFIRDFFDLDVEAQQPNRAAFARLWKFIACRYKENPWVMFSIMNEPFWKVDIPDEATAIRLGGSYSLFMEQIVDTIRSTGARQPVIIDLPFLWNSQWQFTVQPVSRENIIWEAHVYGDVWDPSLGSFKSNLDAIVELFVNGFSKPLFIGEYGFNPMLSIRGNAGADWKTMLTGEISYLDSLPIIGRQFAAWDNMYGEYALFSGESDLTAEESEWVLNTVLK